MKRLSPGKLFPLLALVVLLFCLPAHAAAAHSHKECGKNACSHSGHSSKAFTKLNTGSLTRDGDKLQLTTGRYYLADHVTLDSNDYISISGDVVLCLNN